MHSVILSDGKTININATTVEWLFDERIVRFYHEDSIVARINMDNIVGWVKTDHIVDPSNFVIFKEDEK